MDYNVVVVLVISVVFIAACMWATSSYINSDSAADERIKNLKQRLSDERKLRCTYHDECVRLSKKVDELTDRLASALNESSQ